MSLVAVELACGCEGLLARVAADEAADELPLALGELTVSGDAGEEGGYKHVVGVGAGYGLDVVVDNHKVLARVVLKIAVAEIKAVIEYGIYVHISSKIINCDIVVPQRAPVVNLWVKINYN